MAMSLPGSTSLTSAWNGMGHGLILSRQAVMTHSSSFCRVMPLMLPSSSTPSSTIPPSRLAKATSSFARSWFWTSSRLNSTPEFSPLRIISSSSVRVMVMSRIRIFGVSSRKLFSRLQVFPRPSRAQADVYRTHVLLVDPSSNGFILNTGRKTNNQLGIAKHRNVCIVSRENELPFAFLILHRRHDTIRDEAVIEVILWLIYDERRF